MLSSRSWKGFRIIEDILKIFRADQATMVDEPEAEGPVRRRPR